MKRIALDYIYCLLLFSFLLTVASPLSANVTNSNSYEDKLNPKQKKSLDTLLKECKQTNIVWDKNTQVPRFISGKFSADKTSDGKTKASDFFEKYKELYKINDKKEELVAKDVTVDSMDNTHIKFQQLYQGVEVYGTEIAVHLNKKNEITSVNGRYIPEINIDVTPTVTNRDSFKTALKDVLQNVGNISISFNKPELLVYNEGIMQNEITDTNKLLWKLELGSNNPVENWVYFIDAKEGNIVYKYDDAKGIINRKTYSADNFGDIPGTLWLTEEGPDSDKNPDIVGWLAHLNVGIVHDYFKRMFNFDEWNNDLITTVHYHKDYEGARWFNFLEPPQLVCGDGDIEHKTWGPACNSLDLVGHELTHAILQSKNVNLNCCGQQGAVEESYSDIFGVLIDESNWVMAEDSYFPNDKNTYYRSLSDPSSGAKIDCDHGVTYSQPEHMKDYNKTSCDKYGIHINSGILNKAAYNIASVIGRNKTAHLYYNSMMYLTKDTDFSQLSRILPLICYDLFGFNSKDCKVVKESFNKVGL